jgi:endonuclease/exonuclease/phosphatase family metal-dependent hydrolase
MRRRLRVVTWNVGRLYSPRHNNRLDDADVPAVARVLAELDPDVALLQEVVEAAQLERLAALLAHGAVAQFNCAIAKQCVYDRRVAALVRAEREPRFSEHAIGWTGRAALVADFALADGRRAAAIAAHLDVFSPERRADQGAALAELADGRDEPLVIVGGDLNLDPALAAAAGNRRDVATFTRLTRNFTDAGRDAGGTLLGLFRLDHLLVRGARSSLARVSPRRLPLGDHHPLVLDVDVDNA